MLNDVDMVELTVYLEVAADIYLTWQSGISWLQNDFGILKWNNSYSFQPFMEVDSWPGPLGQKTISPKAATREKSSFRGRPGTLELVWPEDAETCFHFSRVEKRRWFRKHLWNWRVQKGVWYHFWLPDSFCSIWSNLYIVSFKLC